MPASWWPTWSGAAVFGCRSSRFPCTTRRNFNGNLPGGLHLIGRVLRPGRHDEVPQAQTLCAGGGACSGGEGRRTDLEGDVRVGGQVEYQAG